MKAKYWIEHENRYIPYELPEGSCLYCNDMNKEITCARCGKKVNYGDTYTSRCIHNDIGFGYAVCEKCHEQEYKEYFRSKGVDNDVEN